VPVSGKGGSNVCTGNRPLVNRLQQIEVGERPGPRRYSRNLRQITHGWDDSLHVLWIATDCSPVSHGSWNDKIYTFSLQTFLFHYHIATSFVKIIISLATSATERLEHWLVDS
jgi:hypothetical protein